MPTRTTYIKMKMSHAASVLRGGEITVALILVGILCISAFGDESMKSGAWVEVTREAAFSPRDTAEGVVFRDAIWVSNGYYHGNVLTRDLWRSEDGETWARISDATPYDGYSELVVFKDALWAVKGSVWRSEDGHGWEQVLEKTPFGVRGYGEVVVHDGAMWQLGSGADVWRSENGVEWQRVMEDAPYGNRVAAAVEVFQGTLWVMGGSKDEASDPPETTYPNKTTFNDVWCSKDGVQWERVIEHAPWSPRMWFGAIEYGGRLWVLGGFDNANGKNLGDVWVTEDGKTWQEFRSETCWAPRHEPTYCVYRDALWVIAGNTWPVVNDVWRLTLDVRIP
jgi:hypothetical protein